jgi:hypothetical protein
VALALMFAGPLAACGGSDEATTTGDPGEVQFELEAGDAADVSGVRATLTFETPDRTRIVVDGLDEGEAGGGGPNPVRLLGGTCDDPGEIVAELEDLRGPSSETTVDVGLDELLSGEYAVEVSLPRRASEAVACGEVPDEAEQ